MSKLHDELWESHIDVQQARHGDIVMTRAGFAAALDEAMKRQRKACAEALDYYLVDGEWESAHCRSTILNAKVEDNA